jgi:hypothetical protein
LEEEAGTSAVSISDIGQKIAEFQSTGQRCQHRTEVDSIMQAAHQRLDQLEECNVDNGNNSVINQLR